MIPALCLLALSLGGCWGSGPQGDKAQIRHVVRAYLRAQAQGNGPAACALLAPTGQSQLVSVLVTAGRGVISTRPTCPRAVRLLRDIVGASVLNSLVHVRIARIRVLGATARARLRDPARRFPPQLLGLRKGSGGWLIAGVAG